MHYGSNTSYSFFLKFASLLSLSSTEFFSHWKVGVNGGSLIKGSFALNGHSKEGGVGGRFENLCTSYQF